MMEYLDGVRAGRVGVAPEGEASPPRIGERVGSEGVDRLLTAKEELVGLIVRVIAETGVKPLCIKIRDLCNQNLDAVQSMKYRGQWVQVNPAEWGQRTRTTVRVGTGTGNHDRQLAALEAVLGFQAQIQALPGQALVDAARTYAALDDYCKFSELNGASKYFLDPSSPEGSEKQANAEQSQQEEQQKNDQMQLALTQSQVELAKAELQKAQAQSDNVRLKAMVESLQARLEQATADSEATHKDADRDLKKYEIDNKIALELTKIEAQAKQQEDANMMANKALLQEKDTEESDNEKDD
jgi:hypothetical protein